MGTPFKRIFKVQDGKYIYAQIDDVHRDAAATLGGMDITQAIDHVNTSMGGFAVPVQTCKEMAAACSTGASKSANFKRKDAGQGWVIETWEPTWFCFDGEPFSCPKPSTRAGSDA